MNLNGTSYGNGLLFVGFNQDQGTFFYVLQNSTIN